ncbi:MAG: hypothetical protein MI976_21160 [Pseudomonadales bacterium]|nr:hypothetical protein [Pseudomonadales bacterium]
MSEAALGKPIHRNSNERGDKLLLLAGILMSAIFAAVRIYQPFHGDTALYHTAAMGMLEGDLLYVDFWDIKPPGIFLFNCAAVFLFGESDISVKLLQIIWHVFWCYSLIFLARPFLTTTFSVAVFILTAVTAFFASASSWHLAQVESIIAPVLPVCVCLVARLIMEQEKTLFSVPAGLCVGVVAIFKPVLVLIPLLFWLFALYIAARKNILPKLVVHTILAVSFSLIPLSICFIYFYLNGALDEFIHVLLVEPFAFASHLSLNWHQLRTSLAWMSPLCPVIMMSAYIYYKSRNVFHWFDLLVLSNLIAIGVVIGLQPHSWWAYHFNLFFPALGLLFARAAVFAGFGTRGVALFTLLLILPWYRMSVPIKTLVANGVPITTNEKLEFQTHLEDAKGPIGEYKRIVDLGAACVKGQDRIYVLGNPLIYYLSGTKQALTHQGWSLEFHGAERWRMLQDEFIKSKPKCVFVDNFYREVLQVKAPHFLSGLDLDYRISSTTHRGVWFSLKAL